MRSRFGAVGTVRLPGGGPQPHGVDRGVGGTAVVAKQSAGGPDAGARFVRETAAIEPKGAPVSRVETRARSEEPATEHVGR